MSDTHANESLSFMDAFFLYLEQPGAPLNVASIAEFEGVIPLDLCRKYVESKLPLIPRFLMRVAMPTFFIGSPTWQFDQNFDIKNHVREITLQHGTEAEWKSVVSDILSKHLDRNHPLWELTLVHGLESQRTGVVIKIHHCLVDGVAGVALINVLLDPNSAVPKVHRKKLEIPPPSAHEPAALLDTLINSCFSTAQAFLTVHSELLRMAEQATVPTANTNHAEEVQASVSPLARIAPLGNVARLLAELAEPTERLPFNVLSHGPQNFDWAKLPMSEILAVKQACEATVNDVVLTVLSMALRRYAELHDLDVTGRKLRIVVPVNVRDEGAATVTGNQITFLPVDIPWGVRNPRQFLSVVQKRVKFSKTAHGAELIGLIGTLLGALPSSLQALAANILSQLPISVCNSICTNVHGPKVPLYLLGHRLVASYPCVPRGGEMGVNCAVMSYDGSMFVGFTGDSKAIPDLAVLAELFTESFSELRDSLTVPAPKHAPAPKARKPRPKKKKVAVARTKAAATAGLTPIEVTPAEVTPIFEVVPEAVPESVESSGADTSNVETIAPAQFAMAHAGD